MHIDVTHSFTEDVRGFWDIHWNNNPKTGKVSAEIDPDNKSQTLKSYNYQLYRRKLPNGEFFDLKLLLNTYHLVWNDMEFGSDSIIVSFRYKGYDIVDKIAERPGYREWIEDYLKEAYTIGGEIIFPTKPSLNQARGPVRNPAVADRFDLTLRCIQYYYEKEEPDNYYFRLLVDEIKKNGWFFDKFVDFKGYVDFFLLQDCVDENYDTILFLDHTGLPDTVEEYDQFIAKEVEFLRKRNKRIAELDLEDWPAYWVKKVNGEYVELS